MKFKSKSKDIEEKLSTKILNFMTEHPNITFYGGLSLLVIFNIFLGLRFITEVSLIMVNVRLFKSIIGYFVGKNSLILLGLGIVLGSLVVVIIFFEIPIFLLIPDSFIVAYLTGIFLSLIDIYDF